jgi:AraC-like DNA-binding protein
MALPSAPPNATWLNGAAWQFPNFENVDTFVDRLMRANVLVRDPLVDAALQDHPHAIPSRTVRHRFLRATGLTQTHVRQIQRAQRAAALLEQGVSILDTVHEIGYFDQPHLTRSLKRFVGKTPTQIYVPSEPKAFRILQANHSDLELSLSQH